MCKNRHENDINSKNGCGWKWQNINKNYVNVGRDIKGRNLIINVLRKEKI